MNLSSTIYSKLLQPHWPFLSPIYTKSRGVRPFVATFLSQTPRDWLANNAVRFDLQSLWAYSHNPDGPSWSPGFAVVYLKCRKTVHQKKSVQPTAACASFLRLWVCLHIHQSLSREASMLLDNFLLVLMIVAILHTHSRDFSEAAPAGGWTLSGRSGRVME